MRSTTEFGNGTAEPTHAPSSGSRSAAKPAKATRATSPLPGRLSHGEHGEGVEAALAAAAQRLDDQAEDGARRRGALQVERDVLAARGEGAGDVVDQVAALGDRQRHDARRGRRHALDHRLRILRSEQHLDDRPDDARLVAAVGVAHDERVEPVLRAQRVAHAPVAGQDADPADPEVERRALVHEAVVVRRLVRAMEAADADVHDARGDAAAVVRRACDPAAQAGEGPRVGQRWHAAKGTGRPGGYSPGDMTEPERTPDGRYIIVDGRRWRASDPRLPEERRQQLVDELMDARRAVGAAKRAGTPTPRRPPAPASTPRRSRSASAASRGGSRAGSAPEPDRGVAA
jgi:hypothetical protein